MPPTNEAFKKAFLMWEAQAAAQWSALLRDPAFMRRLWQQMERQWEQQRRLQAILQTQLAQVQLPTQAAPQALQEEIAAARAQITALHQQLDALEALIREAAG